VTKTETLLTVKVTTFDAVKEPAVATSVAAYEPGVAVGVPWITPFDSVNPVGRFVTVYVTVVALPN
jgi:hypothetical protein